MDPAEKDYQTEKMTIGNMKMAKTAIEKLAYTQEQINDKIVNQYPPEKMVALRLYLFKITEEEFSKMHEALTEISFPIFVTIQNHLRDFWRKGK